MSPIQLIFLSASLASASALAAPLAVPVKFPAALEAPRWDGAPKVLSSLKGSARSLANLKKAYMDKKGSSCVSQAVGLYSQLPLLRNWLLVQEGQCVSLITPDRAELTGVGKWLDRVQTYRLLLHEGPQVDTLRGLYIDNLLEQLNLQLKLGRKGAWQTVDRLSESKGWMNVEQRFSYLRLSGELAFVEQSSDMALAFYQQALQLRDDGDIRTKVESLKKRDKTAAESNSIPTTTADPDLGISEGERTLLEQLRAALRSGDLVSAVEDAVTLIRKFPGGERAKWAGDRVLEIYLEIAGQSDEKFRPIRAKLVERMSKADGARLFRWANNAYAKGYYDDAEPLAMASYEALVGHPDSTRSLALAASSASAAGRYDQGIKLFERLVVEHFGSPESVEALFRLGLIRYRQGDFGVAASYMERLLALPHSDDFEYRAMYWHWRSLQRHKPDLAAVAVQRLLTKYPVSLYGLKARAELNNNVLTWDRNAKFKVKSDWMQTHPESQSYERVQLLLRAGWFAEARSELSTWTPASSPEERLARAQFYAAAFDYPRAFDLVQKVWEEKPDWQDWSIIKMIYPKEFAPLVMSEAKATNLEPALIWGVIRQESSFTAKAVSPSSAYGLMQVIIPTAQEVAKQLQPKEKVQMPDDLYDPKLNIRFGSYYLGRLIKANKGNVALALASYNAGPGRMRKWLNSRPELKDVENFKPFSVDTDLWVDELPWTETSYYVKAVLRNFLVYRLLDEPQITP